MDCTLQKYSSQMLRDSCRAFLKASKLCKYLVVKSLWRCKQILPHSCWQNKMRVVIPYRIAWTHLATWLIAANRQPRLWRNAAN